MNIEHPTLNLEHRTEMTGTQRPLRSSATGTLTAWTVERLHAVLAGDPVTEAMILQFINERYGARNLFYLPENVAVQVLRRPADFIRAAKKHCAPELPF